MKYLYFHVQHWTTVDISVDSPGHVHAAPCKHERARRGGLKPQDNWPALWPKTSGNGNQGNEFKCFTWYISHLWNASRAHKIWTNYVRVCIFKLFIANILPLREFDPKKNHPVQNVLRAPNIAWNWTKSIQL